MTKREKITRARILDVGLELCKGMHYQDITRQDLADRLGCVRALIGYHVGSMQNFRAELMQRAIDTDRADIVLQGLAAFDTLAFNAPERLRIDAAKTVLEGMQNA